MGTASSIIAHPERVERKQRKDRDFDFNKNLLNTCAPLKLVDNVVSSKTTFLCLSEGQCTWDANMNTLKKSAEELFETAQKAEPLCPCLNGISSLPSVYEAKSSPLHQVLGFDESQSSRKQYNSLIGSNHLHIL